MAYKFQLGDAVMSGALEQEGNINVDGGLYQLDGTVIVDTDLSFVATAITASQDISSSLGGLFKTIRIEDAAGLAGTMLDTAAAADGMPGLLTVDLGEATEAAIVDGDYIPFIDGGATGTTKKEAIHDLATLFAGAGMTATSSSMNIIAATNGGLDVAPDAVKLDLNDLSAAVVDVAADSIAIVDANDSNLTRKESIDDFMEAVAGSGLTNTGGVLSTAGATSMEVRAIADADGTCATGLNICTGSVSLARTWTLPSGSNGDVVRIKAPALQGHTLTISGAYASGAPTGGPAVDNEDHGAVIESDFASITLVYATSSVGGLSRDKWWLI